MWTKGTLIAAELSALADAGQLHEPEVLDAQARRLLDDPRCADNETRVAHRGFVDGVLQDVFRMQSYEVVDANLAAADLAYAPLNTVTALKDHADLHTQNIRVNDQSIPLPKVPGLDKPGDLKVPQLGEHTDAIRHWLEFVSD